MEAYLRAVVEEMAAQLPAGMVSVADHAVAAGRDLNISATGGGVAAGVIHGNVAPSAPALRGRRTPSRVLVQSHRVIESGAVVAWQAWVRG